MFEKLLDNPQYDIGTCSPLESLKVKVVRKMSEIKSLISSGYDLRWCPFFDRLEEKIDKGAVIFFILSGNEAIHASWVFMDNRIPPFDEVFFTHPYEGAGYIGPCHTREGFRGKGIYPYALLKICDFLRENGKTRAVINSNRRNAASLSGIKKSGFRIFKKFFYARFLWRKFYVVSDAKDEA